MELIFEMEIFSFSNSFISLEDILRSKYGIQLKYHATFVQNLHRPEILMHCFNWIELIYVFEISHEFIHVAFPVHRARMLQVL